MAASSGSTETRIQAFVHALEQGTLALVIRVFLGAALVLAVALICLGWKFRGFSDPVAMDHAQEGRELARGHGWSTLFIRPLALWQIETNLGALPKAEDHFPDTFNAPLPPLLDAVAIKLAGTQMKFEQRGPTFTEFIAPAERLIVALSMALFVAAVGVQYLLLRRLFDQRLAFWASAMTLVCDVCWRFTLSGLPQMLMLLLFNLALYALTRAIEVNKAIEVLTGEALTSTSTGGVTLEEARVAGARTPRVMWWLALAGALFGLLALAHALTIWVFAGALTFAAVSFRRRGPVVLVLLLAFALVYAPWLIRTYRVSGSAFGTAGYVVYDGLSGSDAVHQRTVDGSPIKEVELRYFRPKLQNGIITQFEGVVGNLGNNVIAIAFFLCLLHAFRRPEVNSLRWGVLTMWLFAVLGMALISNGSETAPQTINSNQLGILFLPIMLGFGLAFVLVLFSRREENAGLLPRAILFTLLFLVSAAPLIATLLPRTVSPYQYPPYLEPYINELGDWTTDKEIVASDMPWGVAWYADRRSLWLPARFRDLLGLSDNAKLPGTLAGVFLSPVSRAESFYFGIYRGEYSEYQPLIFGSTNLPLFPFQQTKMMLGDLSYTFYTDTPRWQHGETVAAQ